MSTRRFSASIISGIWRLRSNEREREREWRGSTGTR
jgi:hypothetical protein